MKKREIVYEYRGQVERDADYHWVEAYSETCADGGITFPWMTFRECQRDAKSRGGRAKFITLSMQNVTRAASSRA